MITVDALNIAGRPLTPDQKNNLFQLAVKLTSLESAFGSLFKITSGFRSPEDQIHIYHQKGILDLEKIPMHSAHLSGNAADIYDLHGQLKSFLLSEKGLEALEDLGLFCEELSYTPSWCHIQDIPPHSGKRFFIP